MSWKEIAKMDAHVHLIPEEVHAANPDATDEFSFAVSEAYWKMMDAYNIQKAIIMPLNDPWVMSMDFTVEAVHRNLVRLCEEQPGRAFCFADIDTRNSAEESCKYIREAFTHPCFLGIKIHPNNSGMNIDDPYNDKIAECALSLGCPIAVHSYPSSRREMDPYDFCSPRRLRSWMHRHPGLKVIVCHLGGFQWEEAVGLNAYFDISAILPDLAERYGIQKTNAILREFGTDRLLFGTDWPCSRSVPPAQIIGRYMELLDTMDFTETEINQIAFENARTVFGL